jgi:DNA polymerase-3 subunit gamma/tau
VIEIDAASNRSIDDVRQLRENVKYRPARDRYKIYIIDEAHQLTDDAWDALLKTLEEPPEHVVFIFATTERHKLKPTILSRCQNFSFRTLSYHEIYKSLEGICSEEKISITPGALSMLARSAEGSIRDAQSLLDQVISFCGNSIDEAKIRELLGFVSQEYLDRLSAALTGRDTTAILKLVDDVVRAGFDPRHFCREAIQHVRNLMIVRVAGARSDLLELPPDESERLAEVAGHFSEEDLVRFFHLLTRTDNDLKWSTHPRLHLELGLVKLVQAARLMSIEEFLADLKSGKTDLSSPTPASPGPRLSTPRPPASEGPFVKKNSEVAFQPPATTRTSLPSSSPFTSRADKPQPSAPALVSPPSEPAPSSPAGQPGESDQIQTFRQAVLAKSKLLSSMLDHAIHIAVVDGVLLLRFAPASKGIFTVMNTKVQIATLSQICQNVFGKHLQVKLALSDDPEDDLLVPHGGDARADRGSLGVGSLDEVSNDPQVKSFLDTFRAEIVDIKKK